MVESQPSKRQVTPRRKTLAFWVKAQTINSAGFNEYSPSLLLKNTEVHLAHRNGTNIVLVEKVRDRKNESGRRVEWFFGTFEGKPSNECRGDEINQFLNNTAGIIKRSNRVAGRTLEQRIRNVGKNINA